MRDYISSTPQDFSARAKELVLAIRTTDADMGTEMLALELRKISLAAQRDGLFEGSKIMDSVLERLRAPTTQPQAGEG